MSQPPAPPTTPGSRPLSARITDAWQHRGPLACALLPLSWIYAGLNGLRRSLYKLGWLHSYRAPVPVIVIGNVIAGGGGKTPVTMHLVQALQAQGWHPAVVSRGYGRSQQAESTALAVTAASDPSQVGDEPLLIAQRTGVPVFVANKRALAAQAALAAHPQTDVLICDDGLQHLALARDLEIAVFNRLGVGNGWQLPAGPLREAWPRRLDMALYANEPPAGLASSGAATWPVKRQLADYALGQNGQPIPLTELRGRKLRALAAVAYPQEFFAMLQAAGLQLERSDALPDHADLTDPQWLAQLGLTAEAGPTINAPVLLCTEKDAHKLWRIAPQALAVPLQVVIDAGFARQVEQRLQALRPRHPQ
ncbi:tetraacyldisaccharide 4'-kinase [Comamonas sp. J-3]|uniref:tetraacyldisaccharide 4'-kinase n=1 Tax=Comamonas trifloxystrobinivorans TaxID=3350256 RepID=UPI003726F804